MVKKKVRTLLMGGNAQIAADKNPIQPWHVSSGRFRVKETQYVHCVQANPADFKQTKQSRTIMFSLWFWWLPIFNMLDREIATSSALLNIYKHSNRKRVFCMPHRPPNNFALFVLRGNCYGMQRCQMASHWHYSTDIHAHSYFFTSLLTLKSWFQIGDSNSRTNSDGLFSIPSYVRGSQVSISGNLYCDNVYCHSRSIMLTNLSGTNWK